MASDLVLPRSAVSLAVAPGFAEDGLLEAPWPLLAAGESPPPPPPPCADTVAIEPKMKAATRASFAIFTLVSSSQVRLATDR